jgi:proteasome lid subunit RPN8/RPN11
MPSQVRFARFSVCAASHDVQVIKVAAVINLHDRGGPPPVRLILTDMLTITQALVDQIVAHARKDHPDEACGVIAGLAGTDRPERFIPMLNAAMSPTFYEFDSGDLLKLYREMDDRDEEPVVIYHSHTATEAYPSRTDISYANEPGAHYVLVSTADTDGLGDFQFRSYRIVEGEVTEEEVKVVEAY